MQANDVSGAVETIETAPAKINLALHVTGQRADGYHLLETLVTFTEAGDVIRIRDAKEDNFSISGPFGEVLRAGDGNNNLVTRARDLLRETLTGIDIRPVEIHLEKNLPVASGIGGGSADAAATLRGLLRHWNAKIDPASLEKIALRLGADVPMCLKSQSLIARGIGEEIEVITDLPKLFLVLANPLMAVSTPDIFRRLENKSNPALPAKPQADWLTFVAESRNDLEAPAKALLPEISEISALLAQHDATIVRMSGSGATCFGLFQSLDAAKAAEVSLRNQKPDWYFQVTQTI
ncbi:4-(cytidine 5'-diphospho)-2-C-methyl-D-erythritol kinase [Rhizobium sp. RM]|uniref:4-(cytidine 5'-diphospho)-2-C-methyl-D-erythritol kinase n=1 Tax=Rhizobium sp. RM TaxID=2748079 RepID=UPI00110EA1B3|nr:4-(cytidine 5'-diphospho)-2-C-methyl-D-erythritol kinase [Rhizobium sp. RM]NWJ24999.1 4-(cytidine 5'-diphospho)-2-C-methyl-D-erythritol kinase [Rhizobium sp. RM]TMV16777.1 4-(cytidine 5'-diphospho)-2-C-methyl-D-erythritol kinase [Rhizobium sp. Td3]